MRARLEFAGTLLVLIVGAGGLILVAGRPWQHIAGYGDHQLAVTGRTVDGAPTALGVVALAGVVAVIATKGRARQVIGGLLALAGVVAVWRAVLASGAVSASRADAILRAARRVDVITGAAPRVTTSAAWPVLSVVAGALVVLAGFAVAARGARWTQLSARYTVPVGAPAAGSSDGDLAPRSDEEDEVDVPAGLPAESEGDGPGAADTTISDTDAERLRTRENATLWNALERGDDPTLDDPGGPR